MKKTFTLLLLCLFFSAKAQKIGKIIFDKLPDNLQLYPRNDRDEAQVPIAGQIEEAGWAYFSVQIFREDKQIGYQRSNLSYTGDIGKFQFNPITIKAELAEYHFKVFVVNDKKDSTQIVFREHVVAGDAFLIGGQSNALALVSEIIVPYRNKFARSYGAAYPYEPMNWAITEYGNQRVGQLGGGIQKKIIEKYKIPVCIINQAVGGINLGLSLQRNAGNLGDLSNNYGITYARVQKAGFLNGGIKAFIWRQGENESSGGSFFWGGLFDQLFKYWRQDFPDIKQYYVFQVGLIAWPERYAGALRDYQRRTKTIYAPFVENIACVGTKGYDGIHYDSTGHNQTNTEIFRMIDRDLYKAKFTENINSPNVQKAYFSKEDRTRITLEFESDQKMVWVEDTLLYDRNGRGVRQYMKNMFFFGENNTLNDLVIAGRAVDNKIILTLNNPPPAKNTINYLPAFHDDAVFVQFGGPFLKNTIGMRAFSFDEVKIEPYIETNFEPLSTPELSVGGITFQSLKLSWKTVNQAKSYVLQRKVNPNDAFQEIAKLGAEKTQYSDSLLKDNTTYFYRLKAIGDKPESDFGTTEGLTLAKLNLPELSVNVISNQSLKITWKAIPKATSYTLERKTNLNDAYQILAKLGADKTVYSDSLLKDNVTYFYRIKAFGTNTESDFATSQATTPQKLTTPELSVATVSYNSLRVSWKIIPRATSYILERKAALNDNYKEIAKLGSDKTHIFRFALER
ncbi:MAG: fibronectin type III domain-containing protein [Arcicella sp.]|nr:fibronectin type III domain-containing protein [Arcicella sp.]